MNDANILASRGQCSCDIYIPRKQTVVFVNRKYFVWLAELLKTVQHMRRKDEIKVTRLSSSGSSLKKGLWSCSCWWTKFSMSTSKLAEVMHSDPCVACSHFSKSRARRGKRGCLQDTRSVNVVKYSHCKCMAVFRLTFYCITCTCVFLFYMPYA